MKHNVKITTIIIIMFFVSMLIGMAVIHNYDQYFGKTAQKIAQQENASGINVTRPDISFVQETVPPPMEIKTTLDMASILTSIIIAILIAVVIFFFLSKLRISIVLKVWFTVVVFITLAIAFSMLLAPVFKNSGLFNLFGKKILIAELIAVIAAIVLTFFKVVKRNIIVHNATELFIYAGIAVIFVPILNVLAAAILLILISIYDMIAVWKTGHMQKLAKFQMEEVKIFTGFFLPYANKKDKVKIKNMQVQLKLIKSKKKQQEFVNKQNVKVNLAILGGGDVAFPLIFIGTILLRYGFWPAVVVALTTTLALALLLFYSKKGKFYPAMPFLSAGCFLGLLLILI